MRFKNYSQLLYDDKWVQLRRIRNPEMNINGYVYSHEVRCDGKIISILPFRVKDEDFEFLLRSEATPCWELDNPIMSSITGGVDEGMTPLETAVKELEEETGYCVYDSQIISLGKSFGTKSSDTIYHLFSVDLTNYEKTKDLQIETELDRSASCVWVPCNEIFICLDPFVSSSYIRLMNKLFSD